MSERDVKVTLRLEERPIEEHPSFREPRYDWGVIPPREVEAEWHRGECIGWRWEPEDRSGYRPDLDGKSLADFWDYEKREFVGDAPGLPHGVQNYLVPVTEVEDA